MAIYQLGQPGNVILQAAAQVQVLPIVSRTVRDFMHEGVNTENSVTQLAKTQVNQPLRKRHSKISHRLDFLIQNKKSYQRLLVESLRQTFKNQNA